jgi:hypothetical protein
MAKKRLGHEWTDFLHALTNIGEFSGKKTLKELLGDQDWHNYNHELKCDLGEMVTALLTVFGNDVIRLKFERKNSSDISLFSSYVPDLKAWLMS